MNRMRNTRTAGWISTLWLGLSCVLPAVAAADDVDREFLLDLDLRDVSSRDVMWSLARVLGAELSFDPLLDRRITIELRQARVLDALERVCEAIHLADPEGRDCSWRIRAGDPPVLSVGWKALSLELVRADLGSVLFLLGRLIDAESIEVDPALQASTTVDLDDVYWFEALDAVCEQAGCRFRVDPGRGSGVRLVVEGGGAQAESDVSVRLAGGAAGEVQWTPTEVSFALRSLGSRSSGTALFVGAERTFRITAAAGAG
jgi:hypothetical protein